jgi:hypothetical protein
MADAADTRRSVYLLLTAVAVAIAAAKVVGAENVYEPSRHASARGQGLRHRAGPPLALRAARPVPDVQLQRQVALGHGAGAGGRRHLRHRQAGHAAPDRPDAAVSGHRHHRRAGLPQPGRGAESRDEGVLFEQAAAVRHAAGRRILAAEARLRVGHRPRPLAGHPADRVHRERAAVRRLPAAARRTDRRHGQDRLRQAAGLHHRGGRHLPAHLLRDAEQPHPGGVLRAVRGLSAVAGGAVEIAT